MMVSFFPFFFSERPKWADKIFEKISERGKLEVLLILGQNETDFLFRFMEINSVNQKLPQKERAKDLCYSDSSIKRYRTDINTSTPYISQITAKKL